MLLVSNKQIAQLDKEAKNKYLAKVKKLLITEFKYPNSEPLRDEVRLEDFIKRSIKKAYNYGFTKENSITAYVVLSFLNCEDFLETADFKVYKYYLSKKFYDPNEYIFEIPNKNAR